MGQEVHFGLIPDQILEAAGDAIIGAVTSLFANRHRADQNKSNTTGAEIGTRRSDQSQNTLSSQSSNPFHNNNNNSPGSGGISRKFWLFKCPNVIAE